MRERERGKLSYRDAVEAGLVERLAEQIGPERIAILEVVNGELRVAHLQLLIDILDGECDRPDAIVGIAMEAAVLVLS